MDEILYDNDSSIYYTSTISNNVTEFENASNFTEANATSTNTPKELSWVYNYGIGIITILCIISMTVNIRVLLSVFWIRGPLSTTLVISLSLAAADAVSSALLFIGQFLNSYLRTVCSYQLPECVLLALEAFRIGAIVTTVMHLLFLAINHYLGIVRPLHYPNLMTRKLVKIILAFLWILPPCYFLIYFSCVADDGFQTSNCTTGFLQRFKFRIMFTLFLLIPLIAMTIIYTHILIIVRQKQNEWQRRGASRKHRGGTRHNMDSSFSHRGHYQVGSDHHRNHQRMQNNIKALYTTLLILGSFVTGLVPAIITYLMICSDCIYTLNDISSEVQIMFWFVNLLLVTKPLANPIIYAARMQEIKDATRRMRTALCTGNGKCRICSPLLPFCCLCCGCSGFNHNSNKNHMSGGSNGGRICSRRFARSGAESRTESQQLYYNATPRTTVCKLLSNGNTPHLTTTIGNAVGSNTVTFAPETKQKIINDENNTTVL